jgi:hypothetical protein
MFHVVENAVQQNSVFNEPSDLWVAQEQNEDIKPQTFMCCLKLETGGNVLLFQTSISIVISICELFYL